ncbi:hypothetical protein ES704_01351 [subsurface metagenome]
MKKLLLVLLVVALASFLLVGCLPGTTPDDDDDDGNGDDVIVPVTLIFDKEYTNTSGVTFIPCEGAVTVTFPTPVALDYVVYVALKDDAAVDPYSCETALSPNADRTVWTLAAYSPADCVDSGLSECVPLCVVALVKHPCCIGEEVALRVLSVDCTPPELDLFVKFTDCADECVEPDPCAPAVPGAYMEWTSRTTDVCETDDCCEDACSGDGPWSLVIDPDLCLGPCDTAPGEGCPVEGVIECGCLVYDDPATLAVNEGIHYVDFSFEDNVGNAITSTWLLTFDTDSLVTFEVGSRDADGVYVPGSPAYGPDAGGWYQIYDDCTPIPIPS